jgi:hypothetical protein
MIVISMKWLVLLLLPLVSSNFYPLLVGPENGARNEFFLCKDNMRFSHRRMRRISSPWPHAAAIARAVRGGCSCFDDGLTGKRSPAACHCKKTHRLLF